MYFFIIFSIFAQYLEAQIVVGKSPLEVCYNPINHKVYVSRAGASSIVIVDGLTNEITDSIMGLVSNHSLVYNFLNNKLYCAYARDSIAVIDGATNQIIKRLRSANTTRWGHSLYNPINNKIYFANDNSNNVSVIDGERDSLIKIIEEGIGESPTHLCLAEHNNKIYCVNWSGNVSVISSDLDSVINVISVAPCPHYMCYNLRDKKVYVGHWYDPVVEIICAEGDTIITTINVGSNIAPFGICYDSVHNKIYVSTWANYVVVIDGETDNIIDIIYFHGWTWIVFFNPLNRKIYISYENPRIPEKSFIGIIDGRTRRKIDSIPLYRRGAWYPFCLNPQENRVYIPHAWCDAGGNPMDSVISVIRDISEISESSSCFFEIKYFPNSFNPEYIIIPSEVENVGIYEISGKLIKKEKKEDKIFLKDLKSGVYFIKMSSFKKEYIKKLLIIK